MNWVESLDVLFRNKWADEENDLQSGGSFQLNLSDGCSNGSGNGKEKMG